MYPSEVFSQWSREGLRSAGDHLQVWADKAVPLVQYEGMTVLHDGFRWYFTLMRAAIEGAAQSLWLTCAASPEEAVARLIRMVRDDLREQLLAQKGFGDDTALTEERIERHAAEAAKWSDFGKPVERMPAIVDIVKAAASCCDLDEERYVAIWRMCSAAAHGKSWAVGHLQTLHGRVEWRPGQYLSTGVLNADLFTETLRDVVNLVSCGVIRYQQRSGYDIRAEQQRAILDVARRTPQRDGGEHIENAAKLLGWT